MTSRTFGEWAVPRHLAFLSGVSEVFATSQASSATPDPPIVSAFLQNSIFEPQLLREILAFDDPTDLIEPHIGALVAILWGSSKMYGGILDGHDDSGSELKYHVHYFDDDERSYVRGLFCKRGVYCFEGRSFHEGDLVVVTTQRLSEPQLGPFRSPCDTQKYVQLAEDFGECVCELGKVVSVGEDSVMVAMASVEPELRSSYFQGHAELVRDFVFTDKAEVRQVALERLWRVAHFPPAKLKVKAAEQEEGQGQG